MIALLFLLILGINFSNAQIYVGTPTDGGNGAGTLSNPFGSLETAFMSITGGNNAIVIQSGTYTVNAPLTIPTVDFSVSSIVAGATVVVSPSATYTSNTPLFFLPSMSTISTSWNGITFSGFPTGVFATLNAGPHTFTNLIFRNNQPANQLPILGQGSSLYFSGTTATITGCILENNVNSVALQANTNINVTNCRFRNNMANNGQAAGIHASGTSKVIRLDNNQFISNTRALITSGGNTMLIMNNNNIARNAQGAASLNCQDATITASGNMFCGLNEVGSLLNCGTLSSSRLQYSDDCGICEGTNQNRDCNGQCFTSGPFPPSCTEGPVTVVSGDIQTAINAASNGDVLVISDGVYPISAPLTLGGRRITLRSNHSDPSSVVIDCQFNSIRAFFLATTPVTTTLDTVIEGITIQNCMSNGFAVDMDNRVTLRRVNIMNCTSSTNGAGLTVLHGVVFMEDSLITLNTKINIGGGGGGVFISSSSSAVGALRATETRFFNNALTAGAGLANGAAVLINAGAFFGSTRNLYSNNTGGSNAVHTVSTGVLVSSEDSFSFNQDTTLLCATPVSASTSLTGFGFCGGPSLNINCPPVTGAQTLGTSDMCGSCLSTVNYTDCNGVCFGLSVEDGVGGCCLWQQMDCFGRCMGMASFDMVGQCCETSIQVGGLCNFDCTLPCLNGGQCIAQDTCSCDGTGFQGPRCDQMSCGSINCFNGGTCADPMTSTCDCSTAGGFFGQDCTSFDCVPTCANGGACVSPNVCDCTGTGFLGDTCTEALMCDPVCQNGGICTLDTMGNPVCDCSGTDFEGSACELQEGGSSNDLLGLDGTIGIIVGAVVAFLICCFIVLAIIIVVFKKRRGDF